MNKYSDLTLLWNEILDMIEDEITPVSFKTWLKPAVPDSFENGILKICATDVMHKNMLERRYKLLIENSLSEICENECRAEFLIRETKKYTVPDTPNNGGLPLNPKYTFDSFVVGNSNNFAYRVALSVAETPGSSMNPLFIHGGVGLGKTHLLHAIGNYINQNDSTKRVMYVTSETFTNDLINSLNEKKTAEFRQKYRSIDVLMVDDIQFIAGKVRTEEEFFHTFNALYDSNKQIIVTSDKPPKEMSTLEERLKSRFEWGVFGDLYTPDFETRAAILKQKAELLNFNLPDNYVFMIAEKITSNVRELEGVLNKLVAYKSLQDREIDDEVIFDALKNYEKTSLSPEIIIKACTEFYNLSPEEIMGKRKTTNIAVTRQIVMYLLMKLLHMNYVQIGKFMSKDRTTCMHGINKIEEKIKEDEIFKQEINNLIKDITH